MKHFFNLKNVFFYVLVISITFITGCNEKIVHAEHDGYDGPDKAVEFEIERTRDLVTGKVPWEKLRIAIEQTELLKNSGSNFTSALSWIERGPDGDFYGPQGNPRQNNDQTAGRIRAAIIDSLDPTHKTVWVGGVDGGLWKTTDITASPATWVLANDFLANLAVSAICQDPRPGFQNIMYFCTGESFSNADAVRGVGVFKSTDAGATWNFLPSTSTYLNGTRIICDYLGNVYLGTRNTGLLRSTDGGTTWTTITPNGIGTSVCDLEISSTSGPGRLHVATGIFSTSGYRYTDNPETVTSAAGWTTSATPFTTFNQRTELGISGNVLYACPDNASHQVTSIWKSVDGGANWAVTTGQPSGNWANGQGWYDLSVGINPANPNECIVGGVDCYKTSDGGITWPKISAWVTGAGSSQYVHADQHNIQWWDGGTKLMFTCDGGVHYSSDGGTTIRDRNKGLRLKQFYSIAIHPTSVNHFIAGAQDNGMHRLNHPGLDSSIEVYGGDGCYSAIDQNEPQYQFGSYVYNVYRRSTNNGNTWSTPVNNTTTGRFVNPWDYDNNTNIIYACNNAGTYLRWDNPQTGSTTNVISVTEFGGANVSAVHASPYTTHRVYFGMGTGGIIQVDNANTATPTAAVINTGAGMPAGYVNCVVTGSNDQNMIACFTNYGVQNVWVTTNGGTSWTAIDGNLPDMPVRWALFHPDTDTKAYIATETGVWETDLINGASTVWAANSTFPNVRTDMIKYRTSDRTIAAGTHGRGIWTATVPGAACTPASVTTNPVNSTICAGANTTFSVVAGGTAPFGYQWQLSTAGAGGPWNNISNGGVYSGATTATLAITGATVGMTTYQYRCVVTGNCAPLSVNSNPAILTVNATTVINTQPVNSTVCAAANTSFSVAAAGTSITYQWQLSTTGAGGPWNNISNGGVYSGATTTTLNLTGVTAGMNTYQYRCVVTGTCGVVNSNPGLLTVNTAPAITGQPVDLTTCAGNSAVFSVTATGSSLTYQWQESTNGGGTWNNLANVAPYSNVTTATLTINPAAVGMNNYQYRCVVTGVCPPSPLNSNAAVLTVGAPMGITAQPANAAVCAGQNTSFSITTSGTVLGYQWQESTNGGGTWNNVTNGGIYSNATTATLNLTGVTAGMNNYQYRCVINGNCPSINSNAAILTVNTAAAVTSNPVASTICATQSTSFSVAASGSSLTYQWQVSTTGCGGPWADVVNGAPYSGATSATLTITGATTALNGYGYRCNVTGLCAPLTATSNCALLTVNTPVNITTQPLNATICAGQNTSFIVAATGTGLTYQWQESTNGGGTWNNITNGGIYGGATTTTLALTGVTAGMNNFQYRCVVSGATGCTASNSTAAILTVNTAPNITANPVNSTICVSQTTSFSVTASGTGLTYQWQESITGCGGAWANVANGGVYSGATSATLTITGAPTGMTGYGYRCIVSGTCAPAATSNCGLLTVNTAVNISGQPVASTVCAGQNTSFVVTATGSGLTYQWQESTNGGGTWNNITNGGIYGGATTTTLTLTGVTAVMNNNQYRCIVSGGAGCTSATSAAAILTVNTAPAITTQPVSSTICATQSTSFSVVANGTAISYQWQESTTPGCAGPWVNIANGGIYSGATTSTLTLTAAPATMNGYGYRCIITGTCAPSATSNCAQLTVNTPLNITTQPANSTVCAGANTTFSVAVTGTTPTYQWQESTNGGGTWNNITNGGIYGGATTNTLALTGVTAGMNSYQYRCIVTAATACASANSGSATLTVNTAPAITTQPATGAAVCAGQVKTYNVAANGTALTYQWQESTNGGGTWTNIVNGGIYGGATTNTLTLTGVTVAMNNNQYRCIISGTCAPAATSAAVTITVYTPITITTAPANATICATGTTSFSVLGAGTTPTYQWQESTNGGGTWTNIVNGGIYSGATTTTLTLTGVTAGMNGNLYRAVVTGAAPCSIVNSASATLTVSPQPLVTLTAAPYTRLLPGRTTIITASVNPLLPFTAVWTLNGAPITATASNTYTADVDHLGTYTVIATIGTCTSLPASIIIADSASTKLWIYPSPNDGAFTVSYYTPGATPTNKLAQRLTIYDTQGRLVYKKDLTISQAYNLEKVDMRRNKGGLYYVVLRDANGKQIKTGEVVIR